jgi:hypothetical protein
MNHQVQLKTISTLKIAPALALPKMLGFFQAVEALPAASPAPQADVKSLSPEQIRSKLTERFNDNYTKKTYPDGKTPENEPRLQEFTANREKFIDKVMAYQTYEKLVAEKEKGLEKSPNLFVRTEVQKDILANPKSTISLIHRADFIPGGEDSEVLKYILSGAGTLAVGGIGACFGALATPATARLIGASARFVAPITLTLVGLGAAYVFFRYVDQKTWRNRNIVAHEDDASRDKNLQTEMDWLMQGVPPTPTPTPNSNGFSGGF